MHHTPDMLYRERLLPGPLILALGVALFLMVGAAYSRAFGSVLGVALGLLVSALFIGFACATAPYIRLEESDGACFLTAGRARISIEIVGSVSQLSPDRRVEIRRGRSADTAFSLIRGSLPVVELEILDPLDPHGLWCLSTRNPQELIRAITTAKGPKNSSTDTRW
ncbi:MAG: DUF3093 family protein [Candidatus Nanopelagicales bacterium]|mgnify:CR=1 FL=1|nr:hypothetical protein [Actinomycetota bacterium]